ncbi:LOW QUALITY PROTEIN: hypothetical protein PHMEG_00012522 [Phytophthora megakarya]|uniref:Uncharacterized protein n=1 Tax=Phytophthora megakarya TaxID=4795 RepID=A0A225WA80_9STRA|nr:LOW QUALITY PROTEIN: hypothetical protein PHMEG_00012522 [Phytophthora megakarya]
MRRPTTLSTDVPLVELIYTPAATITLAPSTAKGTDTSLTIYALANRILDRVALAAGAGKALSSHSFRRGGTLHANGSARALDIRSWILKYEHHKQGVTLRIQHKQRRSQGCEDVGGYKPKEAVTLQDLSSFDSQTHPVLTAAVFRHFPHLKALNPDSPAVTRIENAVTLSGSTIADLLAWSSHLALPADIWSSKNTLKVTDPLNSSSCNPNNEQKIIGREAAVIKHVIDHSRRRRADGRTRGKAKQRDGLFKQALRTYRYTINRSKHPHEETAQVWRHASPCRLAEESKRQRSKAKLLAAFMKLFLADGFALDLASGSYRDDVLELGKIVEEAIISFLRTRISRRVGRALYSNTFRRCILQESLTITSFIISVYFAHRQFKI